MKNINQMITIMIFYMMSFFIMGCLGYPSTSPDYFERGRVAYANMNYDLAIAEYTEEIRRNPSNAAAYNNRGLAYRERSNSGDLDRAIADFDQAIRLGPTAVRYLNRGNTHRDRGNVNLAIEDYSQAIRLDVNYSTAYNNRGDLFYRNGEINRAITDFETALRIDPNFTTARNNLAIAQQRREELRRSELHITSVVPDGSIISMLNRGGRWPQDGLVAPRWNNVRRSFNLVQLQNDPFNPNELIQRIGNMASNVTDAFPGGKAYTVYFTMGDRRFICFIYYEVTNLREYSFWAFEVR